MPVVAPPSVSPDRPAERYRIAREQHRRADPPLTEAARRVPAAPPTPPRASRAAGAGSPRVADRLGRWSRTSAAFDVAASLVYVCFSVWLSHGLWPSPATRAIADNVNDQALIEWFLAHGVLFWTGDFSLVTDRLNAPDGVNLMSNASHILHGVLMAPVTVIFGVATTVRRAHRGQPGRDGRRLVPAARPRARAATGARRCSAGRSPGSPPA